MELVKFKEVNLEDPFFDSLKADYKGFEEWFGRKSDNDAYIQKKNDSSLQAFLYLKIEDEAITDVIPNFPEAKRLKVGTFKIEAHNTKLGERFVRMIMHHALYEKVEEIYVTIFEKHVGLVNLLKKYGFEKKAIKGDTDNPESVYVKSMKCYTGDICKDFPFIHTAGKNKYLLAIYPKFHTVLFPDSILNTEIRDKDSLIKDVSHTNSIHKIYLCRMEDAKQMNPGDLVVIYRTSDDRGSAMYRSVATSVCVVEEVKTPKDFKSYEEYIKYTNYYSIFDKNTLTIFYNNSKTVIIKMTYNAAFNRRIIRKELIEEVGISQNTYWGFLELTGEQFNGIIERGQIDESLIVD